MFVTPPVGFVRVEKVGELKPGTVLWVDGVDASANLTVVVVRKTKPIECCERGDCPGFQVIGAASPRISSHSVVEGVEAGRIWRHPTIRVDVSGEPLR